MMAATFTISAFADEIDSSLTTQMDVLEQHAIHHIEMRGVNGRPLVQHSLDEVREIKRQLDARGFAVSAVGSPIGKIKITDDFGPHMELFRHTLAIARILETKYIRVFSFFLPEGEDPGRHRAEVMRRMKALAQAAEGSGVVLVHENEKDIYGDTPERCLDMFEELGCDYFRATFDPANFVQCGVEVYPHAYEVLKDRIEYVHIKDAIAGSGQVVPSGYGDGKIPEVLTALDRRGFEGFLSLEPHLGSFDGLEKLELKIDTSRLPRSGAGTFAVAADALKEVLGEIV